MKVTIDGKEYELNVEAAKKAGLIEEVLNLPCEVGDVYLGPYVKLFLVRDIYSQNDDEINHIIFRALDKVV